MQHEHHGDFMQLLHELHKVFEAPKCAQNSARYTQNQRPRIGQDLREATIKVRCYRFDRARQRYMLPPMRKKRNNVASDDTRKHQI